MRTPWHIRAWATGASLAINGALALGVMTMNAAPAALTTMDDDALLISLGDPALTTPDNATSPQADPTPERSVAPPPPPIAPAPAPVKPRPVSDLPDNFLAAAPPRPPQPAQSPAQDPNPPPRLAAASAESAGAKAMAATAARPPAGTPDADSLQAHPGSSNSYAARVRAWLESHKTYPQAARARKQQGVARLTFVIDRSGRVLDCRLTGSAGAPLLDKEALAMVARADPFPAPPHTVKGDRIELEAPVEFSLAR